MGVIKGAVAFCKEIKLEYNESYLEELLNKLDRPPLLLLVLDGVTDPHNLGACLRSAEAAGVDAVIVAKDKSALMNATVRKVACWCSGDYSLYRCNQSRALSATIFKSEASGLWVQPVKLISPSIALTSKARLPLVLGAEGSGFAAINS